MSKCFNYILLDAIFLRISYTKKKIEEGECAIIGTRCTSYMLYIE